MTIQQALPLRQVICGDCLEVLSGWPSECIDLLATDPPYGLSFMGKDWDKAVPSVEVWRECLRVLKSGSFAFIMSSPRLDCLGEMSRRLQEAGFETGFTPIFWTYASGFPKAMNISKAVDKRLGYEREIVGIKSYPRKGTTPVTRRATSIMGNSEGINVGQNSNFETKPASDEARVLDGSYAGFQPKPAVEVVIVAMKPLSEKTFVEQALKNSKGVTWLDDCRIPFQSEDDKEHSTVGFTGQPLSPEKGWNQNSLQRIPYDSSKGRFPANLLVNDDTLNDGFRESNTHYSYQLKKAPYEGGWKSLEDQGSFKDEGSFSRYFDLDRWFTERVKQLPPEVRKTFPFLIVPKASSSERNEGCEELPLGEPPASARSKPAEGRQNALGEPRQNFHPTVKPVDLMSYLVTLGSRPDDIILDPFIGSGTTGLACELLARKWVGIELNKDYCEIARKRLEPWMNQSRLDTIDGGLQQ